MVKPVYKVFGILFIIPAIFVYINLLKDYSNNIKSIAEPMRDKVLVFKEKYGRYPSNLDESLKLLKSSGCYNNTEPRIVSDYEGQNLVIYNCKSKFKDMLVNVEVSQVSTLEPMRDEALAFNEWHGQYPSNFDEKLNLSNAKVTKLSTHYELSFYKGYTRCHITFDKSNRTDIRCYQNSLIKWNA